MISVDEAKKIITQNVSAMPSIKLPLIEATGYVLAEDAFSTIDFPPFDQSSVDGYALAFNDAHEQLTISGEIAAGKTESAALLPKHAMRIFTGAAVPANADTIVMQEKVLVEDNKLIINDEHLQQGINFRPKGKDVKLQQVALQKNAVLTPGAVGFLSGLGITEISVYKNPAISIIITGNELQQPGKPLQYGQVYESNSFMLKTALQQLHFNHIHIIYADDNLEQLTSLLNDALDNSDMILLCGGISVGDYDFVLQAAANCCIKKLFHKLKQRPGKPLYFGKKDNKYVFGLPGNPSSVLTCFYEYVLTVLAILTNRKNYIRITNLAIATDYKKIDRLTFFLKGLIENDKVIALDAQESYRLSSYAIADCLICLEEKKTYYKKGDIVEVHVLPN